MGSSACFCVVVRKPHVQSSHTDYCFRFSTIWNIVQGEGIVVVKQWMAACFDHAMALNKSNIIQSLPAKVDKFLDLGCDDGVWTCQLASQIYAQEIVGVDIVQERLDQASKKGVVTVDADLSGEIPLPSNEFDLIHANQVIEHVPDVDCFASEIFRLLKPSGRVVLSTENTSSWHNIFASLFGWQIFSSTNVSVKKLGIGNPWALHRGEQDHLKTWTHKVIFSYRGLKEFCEAHGFRVITIRGAGYYPLPAWLGDVDVRHAHFITVVCEKPKA